MFNEWTNTKDDSIRHVWNFPWVCQQVGFWCRCTWFGFLGSRLIRSNSQSRVTMWVLETCLIVGLLLFMIILNTAALSSEHIQQSFLLRRVWRLSEHNQYYLARWSYLEILVLSMITGRSGLSVVWVMYPKTEAIRSHNSRAGKPSNLIPASKEMNDFWFCWTTEVCFLHIQLFVTHVWLPKMHSVLREVGFRIFKISREVRIYKQSQSALFFSITHIAMLFVFTYVMNVWNQSIQAFVTGFGPFCDRSCKFVHWQ